MKKNITVSLLLSLFLLVSCGKSKTSANGCYKDINSAKIAAQKNNQDILVVVTMAGDDVSSQDFVTNVLNTESFAKDIASKYAAVHMDFSQASYEKTVVNPEADKKTQKAAEEYALLMQENAKFASLMNVQNTPALFLFTKEVYVITELDYTEDVKSSNDLVALIQSEQTAIDNVHAMVEAVNNSSKLEKVTAIDRLYEATELLYQPFLKDLIAEVLSIDKKNESGVLSKYIMAKADSDAAYLDVLGDAEGASDIYVKICDNEYLLPEYKQQAYYLAAYLLSMSGSTDFDKILGCLEKSLEADPQSEQVPNIQNVINYFKEAFSNMQNTDSLTGEL